VRADSRKGAAVSDYPSARTRWMPSEDAYLREHFPLGDPAAIEAKLCRTWEACRSRASELKVKRIAWTTNAAKTRAKVASLKHLPQSVIARRCGISKDHARDILAGRIKKRGGSRSESVGA
jgi:hypothetical protein